MSELPGSLGSLISLAGAWVEALAPLGGPMPVGEDLPRLAGRLALLADSGLAGLDEAEQAGIRIGRLLAESYLTGAAVVQRAVTVLGDEWLKNAPAMTAPAEITEAANEGTRIDLACVTRMQGGIASGHATAVQRLLLAQQEAIHRATITARDQADSEAKASQTRFRAVFSAAAVGIGLADLSSRFLDANPALQTMLGYSLEDLCSRRAEELVHPDDAIRARHDHLALVAGEINSFHTAQRYVHRDGRVIWANLSVSLVRSQKGDPLYQVVVVEDITTSRQLQERLLHEANHDPLPGLPNRAQFLKHVDAVLADPAGNDLVAVGFLDLDAFKLVNESRGYLAGDQVLVAVAHRLVEVVQPQTALLARVAGDKFAVLWSGLTDRLQSQQLANDLLASLERPIKVEGQPPVVVRASVGLVELSQTTGNAKDLLREADLALRAAKETTANQTIVHDPLRVARQITRFTIAMSLPGVVDRGELEIAYQPLIRLSDGVTHSLEALLRWCHPELGRLSPCEFLEIAEESSTIEPIGRWVIDQACRDLAASDWPAVNINVSLRQLHCPHFVDDVRRSLDDAGLDPSRLRMEISESVIMNSNDPGPLRELRRLADLGVRIVVDGFGAGYSNLTALRRLPLHELKISARSLQGLDPDQPPDPVDTRILTTLVTLAHTLGLTVAAEGVETAAQAELVRAMGCDLGQGWFFAPADVLASH